MKKTAEDYLGEQVTDAVITVPAYFNDAQRQATKDAGRIAGLEVKRIVNEPTASASPTGWAKNGKDEKIAVYDLGGGTFDISILELGDGVFEVKSPTATPTWAGTTSTSGSSIGWWRISRRLWHRPVQGPDGAPAPEGSVGKGQDRAVGTQTTDINLPFITADSSGPKHLQYPLTRAKFEQMVDDLIQKSKNPCIQAMKDAGMTAENIDEVILVGGSTRIPAVQKLVRELFKKEPNKGVNPDEVVAMGASIQGGILGGDVKGRAPPRRHPALHGNRDPRRRVHPAH